MNGVICCDTCPFTPTCEEEEDQVSHSYRPREHDDYPDGPEVTEDGEQCVDCLRFTYDPHQDLCLACGHGQLRQRGDDYDDDDDDYLADFIPEDWSGEAMT